MRLSRLLFRDRMVLESGLAPAEVLARIERNTEVWDILPWPLRAPVEKPFQGEVEKSGFVVATSSARAPLWQARCAANVTATEVGCRIELRFRPVLLAEAFSAVVLLFAAVWSIGFAAQEREPTRWLAPVSLMLVAALSVFYGPLKLTFELSKDRCVKKLVELLAPARLVTVD